MPQNTVSNVKPAPFDLSGALVAAAIGTLPVRTPRVTRVPILPIVLVDEVKGLGRPSDVPALLRPDTMPVSISPRPSDATDGLIEPPRVALLEAAVSVPAEIPNLGRPGIAHREKIALPPLSNCVPMLRPLARKPVTVSTFAPERRHAEMAAATSFLRRLGILVTVCDRAAQVREYRVTGKRDRHLHEGVIEIAQAYGFEGSHGEG